MSAVLLGFPGLAFGAEDKGFCGTEVKTLAVIESSGTALVHGLGALVASLGLAGDALAGAAGLSSNDDDGVDEADLSGFRGARRAFMKEFRLLKNQVKSRTANTYETVLLEHPCVADQIKKNGQPSASPETNPKSATAAAK